MSITKNRDLTDYFYDGVDAFGVGKSETDKPLGLSADEDYYWIGGFRSAARRAANPRLSRDEYEEVANAAHKAGREDRVLNTTRDNPFCPDQESERNDVWATVYLDGRLL